MLKLDAFAFVGDQWTQIDPKFWKFCLGLFFILAQCMVWIMSSITTQYLYENSDFDSPFFMTYTGMSLLSLFLPFKFYGEYRAKQEAANAEENNDIPDLSTTSTFDQDLAKATDYQQMVETMVHHSKRLRRNKIWNHKKHALAALHVTPAMFLADWAFNKALADTTVASCTVLVSTTCVFVYLMAVALGSERFHWLTLLGVVLAVVGTASTATEDNDTQPGVDKLTGDLFAILAAMGYAIYTVQVRLLCPKNEENYSMTLFLGYVGLICMVTLAPVCIYSLFDLTLSWFILGIVALKGLFDFVIIDYLLFKSVMLTNATISSVGLGMTIPFAFIADWLMGKPMMPLVGPICIAISFLLVNLFGSEEGENTEGDEHPVKTEEEERKPDMAGTQGLSQHSLV